MGGYFTKRMLLLLTTIMLLPFLISSSSGEPVNPSENGVCIAKEGPFLSSESEGKLPKLADHEFEDLNLCKVFHGKTCCSASRMLSATYGEAVKDCLDLFERIQSGTLRMCASFCDRVFEACSAAYFSSDATDQVIVPCDASKDIIWESNVTAFCYAVNFTVQTADDSAEEPCHGIKSSLEPVVEEPLAKCDNCACARFLFLLGLQIIRLVAFLRLRKLLLERLLYQQQMRAMNQRNARRTIRSTNEICLKRRFQLFLSSLA